MKKLVIFGLRDLAQLARFYFEQDKNREVAAFTVDRDFRTADIENGLPVVDFETVEKHYPPENYDMFLPITHKQMGHFRKKKFFEAKAKGYKLATYISPRATYYNTPVGENCFIFEDNTIQPFTVIGDNVIIWSGNHIGHHSHIGDHVFITSHAVVSGHVKIGAHSFLGVNSTIRDDVTLGEGTLVGMGASITKDTILYGVYTAPSAKVWEGKRSDEVL